MFLLVALYGVLYAVGKLVPMPDWWAYHLSHPKWTGFSFWDIIMPCFIFMCGSAIPLSVGRRIDAGESPARVWRHVLLRVAMLWFFGLLTQGNLASLDVLKIKPYCNTLQMIAVGYLIAVAVLYLRSKWLRMIAPAALALLYTALLGCFGDYSDAGNFAREVELKVLRLLCPDGSIAFETHGYTWWLTSLMSGATTLCGVLSTDVLRTEKWTPWKRAGVLAAFGVGLLALGFAVEPWVPCIKHIFSLSFTAQAMGYCMVTLAALYVLTDIWKCRAGTGVLLLYGQHALAAYMLSNFFRKMPGGLTDTLTQGFPHLLGQHAETWMPMVRALVYCLVLTWMVGVWCSLKNFRMSGKKNMV